MKTRRQAREAALEALFMSGFSPSDPTNSIDIYFSHFHPTKEDVDYATSICEGVLSNAAEIDHKITCASANWSVSRMNAVDRWILRIATCEMFILKSVPVNVAINEAIELAKAFSSDESSAFVNGVLDKIALEVREPAAIKAA